jgi:hypothetical protein
MRAAAAIVLVGYPLMAGAEPIGLTFSIDPASPSVNGSITPDDLLRKGPVVHTPGTALGLADDFFGGFFDNLDALSFGRDPILNPLFFSVDRVAVGLPFTDVHNQAQPGVASAAGDVYVTVPGGNRLVVNETELGLVAGFFGDDLDALDIDRNPGRTAYFSIDAVSATNGFGAGGLADDILASDGGGSFGVFCEGLTQIGLSPGDDLDALVLDAGQKVALFSLTTFSPSTFTTSGSSYVPGLKGSLSPADVLMTRCDGQFSLWAPAAALGLRADDELDALDTTVAVPEPAAFSLLAAGLLARLLRRRFRRSTEEAVP